MMDSESRISVVSDHKLCHNKSAGRNIGAQRQLRGMLSSQRSVDNNGKFLLPILISEKVFSITDKLSKALQKIYQQLLLGVLHLLQYVVRVEK